MNKTSIVVKKTNKRERLNDKNRVPDSNKGVLSQIRSEHSVSRDFLASRESRYQFVDIIDQLFDAAIGY